MTKGSTPTPPPFRHPDLGVPCPVLPVESCDQGGAHHRPKHCAPVPAKVRHTLESIGHVPKRRRPGTFLAADSFRYSTTEAHGVTR